MIQEGGHFVAKGDLYFLSQAFEPIAPSSCGLQTNLEKVQLNNSVNILKKGAGRDLKMK